MEIEWEVLLAATTAYGAVVTKVVDAVRNTLGANATKWAEDNKWVWNVVALALGVGVALLFEVDAVASGDTRFGALLTGLAIGASASGFHEVFDAFSGVAKKDHALAGNKPQGTTI